MAIDMQEVCSRDQHIFLYLIVPLMVSFQENPDFLSIEESGFPIEEC